jgi:membrane-bound ClpP family serine protease
MAECSTTEHDWEQAAPLDLSDRNPRTTGRSTAKWPATSRPTGKQLRQLYHFEGEPETIEPNWAHQLIESLSSPQIAGVLALPRLVRA